MRIKADGILARHPTAFTFITSVSRLRAGFSFHFPVNGLSAAHNVPLARQIHSNTLIERFAIDSSTNAEFPDPRHARQRPFDGWCTSWPDRSRTYDDLL